MWEYEVMIGEDKQNAFFIWGYNFKNACKRNHLNPDELTILFSEYID